MARQVPFRDVQAAAQNIRRLIEDQDGTIEALEKGGRWEAMSVALQVRDAYASALRILEAAVPGV